MKWMSYACLVAGGLAWAAQAIAAPEFQPFLSVDINGYAGDEFTSPGPTEAGFLGWTVQSDLAGTPTPWNLSTNAAGISTFFNTSEGQVNVTMTAFTGNAQAAPPQAGSRDARNREPAQGGPLPSLRQDFVFAGRSRDGFGQHAIKLELSGPGILANQAYEFTGFAQDIFNPNNVSFQAWTDKDRLDGADGPGAWRDIRYGAGNVYQPAAGGANNNIPHGARSATTGAAPGVGQEYLYSGTIRTRADGLGVITVYTFADSDSYTNSQTVTMLNGFQLGIAPEPTSFAIMALGLVGIAGLRRRSS